MIFCTSGANAAMAVPAIATLNAAIASRLCGAIHVISRLIQPVCFASSSASSLGPWSGSVVAGRTGLRSGRGSGTNGAGSSTASTSGSSRSAIAASAVVERRASRRGHAQADRAAVSLDRLAGQVAPLDEAVDDRADARLGDGEPSGQEGCPLVAGRDQGQDPVLGEGEVAGGPLEHPGRAARSSGPPGAGRPCGEPPEW